MESVRTFTEKIDVNYARKLNMLQYFRENGLMLPSAHRVSALPPSEKAEYESLLQKYKTGVEIKFW